jgi:glycerol-3-phosphate dehydrogenase subunit C
MSRHVPGPREDVYWSRAALVAEEKRVFEICNGCRLCFNLCPSFPSLFDAIDSLDSSAPIATPAPGGHSQLDALGNHEAATAGAHDAPPRDDIHGQAEALEKLPLSVHQKVVDECYQCKLCDPICPYVPPHEFAVDFPRLMLRHKAIDAREHGVKFQDRVLGDPDLVGTLGTLMPSIANFANSLPVNRVVIEKVAGIHRDRQLPTFASETFLEWFRKRHPEARDPKAVDGRKVVLFYTCSVQWNEPQVGRAAVEVLEHSGITVFVEEFKCCGMPALDGGDVPRATSWATHNIERLRPFVDAGCDIVSPGPTCSYMMKKEWPDYVGSEDADAVSKKSFDLMEYLNIVRKAGELKEDYNTPVGSIGYHVPCHLKVQKIGFRSRDMMKTLPEAKVTLVDKCSCMDGTWGMKTEWYEMSKKGAQPLLEGLTKDKPTTLSSDCLIAKLQIEEGTGQKVIHPIEVVHKALGLAKTNPGNT